MDEIIIGEEETKLVGDGITIIVNEKITKIATISTLIKHFNEIDELINYPF